ncbi:MAG: DUF5666 domain-containing protein [Gammaproteobacteria bacterium]
MLTKASVAMLPILVVVLAACGGSTSGNGSAQTGSGRVTTGVISGFGSVFVNGVRFETGRSQFTIEGSSGAEEDLDVGMVVTVEGPVNEEEQSGEALEITYDSELEGIVLANNVAANGNGELDVMGQTVLVDAETVFESEVEGITSVDLIQVGNMVEVSGFSDNAGTIHATRIAVLSATHEGQELEVNGTVTNLTPMTFSIGKLAIDYSGAVLDGIPDGMLSDGLLVKVESTSGLNADGALIADSVDGMAEENAGSTEGELELAIDGVVTAVISGAEFAIGGRLVRITDATIFEEGSSAADIAVGANVLVEGQLDSEGVLIADTVEITEGGEIEMAALIEAIDPQAGTITVLGQTISVNSRTMVSDNEENASRDFSVDDLAVGDLVRVVAFRNRTQGGQ